MNRINSDPSKLTASSSSSSLERMESNHAAMLEELEGITARIKRMPTPSNPQTSAVAKPFHESLDFESPLALSQLFMPQAEIIQPWLSIGIDSWLQAGKWWLVKVSRSDLLW